MLSSLAALRYSKLTGHWLSSPPEQVYHLFRLAVCVENLIRIDAATKSAKLGI
jgi:hypothetical protein